MFYITNTADSNAIKITITAVKFNNVKKLNYILPHKRLRASNLRAPTWDYS